MGPVRATPRTTTSSRELHDDGISDCRLEAILGQMRDSEESSVCFSASEESLLFKEETHSLERNSRQ